MGVSSVWGGRWTAVYSPWTYVHRMLHILGIEAVDNEEVTLLSAPLVRIHLPRRWEQPLVLAHDPTPQHPDEPLCWVNHSHISFMTTLFLLHFDSSDTNNPDRARLATAAPIRDTPRSWLSVDTKTGRLSLTVSELSAAVFNVKSQVQGGAPRFALQYPCNTGRFLSTYGPSHRARIVDAEPGYSSWLYIHVVPLPPTLSLSSAVPTDPTLASAFNCPRTAYICIQSKALGFCLAAKPDSLVNAAHGASDNVWRPILIDYDCHTRSAVMSDARGRPLYVSSDGLRSVPEDWPRNKVSPPGRSREDRFNLTRVEDDDAFVIMTRRGYLSARRGNRLVISQDTSAADQEQFVFHIVLPSQTDDRAPRVLMRMCENGVRQLNATVTVAADVGTAFDVITDYNGFKDFMEDASESEILERRNDRELTVRMVQCHSFLMLTLPISMTLDVVEEPERHAVTLKLIKGLGIREYKGVWTATSLNVNQSTVCCTLWAATAVPAPSFLVNGLMINAMTESMMQIREECTRRQAGRKKL